LKLKLSEIANLAEVVGALAVVISLVYVGIQVTDGTRAIRSSTANETSTAMSSWYIKLGTSPQSTKIFRTGMAQPETLTQEEIYQFIVQVHGLFMLYQNAYYLSQQGTLDVELQESITNTILGVRTQPGFDIYWSQRKDLFKPSFKVYVEELRQTGITNTNMERIYQKTEQE
jgi:hypothetical protein